VARRLKRELADAGVKTTDELGPFAVEFGGDPADCSGYTVGRRRDSASSSPARGEKVERGHAPVVSRKGEREATSPGVWKARSSTGT
jgi:hypothetical protein